MKGWGRISEMSDGSGMKPLQETKMWKTITENLYLWKRFKKEKMKFNFGLTNCQLLLAIFQSPSI